MEPSEMEITQIGIDTSKHVFTLHGVDASGAAILRRDLKRSAFEAYMAKLAPMEVALEACGGAHHWARRLRVDTGPCVIQVYQISVAVLPCS